MDSYNTKKDRVKNKVINLDIFVAVEIIIDRIKMQINSDFYKIVVSIKNCLVVSN